MRLTWFGRACYAPGMGIRYRLGIPSALGFWVSFALAALCPGEEFRTFTNKDGKQLEATTLGVDLEAANVRLRLRDGREFAIPIGTLSLDDQAWLVNWEKEERLVRDPGGWHPVEISLPRMMSHIEAPGCYGAFYRVGLNSWRGEIPEGAWLRVTKVLDGDPGDFVAEPELILRFDGRWKSMRITFEDGFFRASFDGAAPVLVGATGRMVATGVNQRVFDGELTYEKQEEQLKAIAASLPDGKRICFQLAMALEEREMRRYRDLFDAFVIEGSAQEEVLQVIGNCEVRGLRINDDLYLDRYDVSNFSTIEFLSVEQNIDGHEKLADFEALAVVELSRIDGRTGLGSLARVPNLRLVEIGGLKDDETVFALSGWDQLANLRGIDFDLRFCQIDAESVGQCQGLRAVRFDTRDLDPGGGWMNGLGALRNIYWSSRLDRKPLVSLAQTSSWAPHLRSVTNWNTTPFAQLPSLRAVIHPGSVRQRTLTRTNSRGERVMRTGDFPYLWPEDGISEAEFLEFIQIDGVSQEMLDAIFAKKNPASVRTLILSNLLDCTDFSGLKKLRNLRVLSISNLRSEFLDTALEQIDVRSLESLEVLEVVPNRSGQDLEVLRGDVPYVNLPNLSSTPLFLQQW